MNFNPPLIQGIFLRRCKRFLADVRTAAGEEITIHCPNTGSMRECLAPLSPCWYSLSDNPKRKYAATWEIATTPAGHLAGINTGRANALVGEAIGAGLIAELAGWENLTAEVRFGAENSRADWCLSRGDQTCYLEVKNVTLFEDGRGYFPDAVSARGSKHLRELIRVVQGGHRAVLVYCVQHSAIESVTPAVHIDKDYAQWCGRARQAGVEFVALKADISPVSIQLTRRIPVLIE